MAFDIDEIKSKHSAMHAHCWFLFLFMQIVSKLISEICYILLMSH